MAKKDNVMEIITSIVDTKALWGDRFVTSSVIAKSCQGEDYLPVVMSLAMYAALLAQMLEGSSEDPIQIEIRSDELISKSTWILDRLTDALVASHNIKVSEEDL